MTELLLERSDTGVATLTLSRPQRRNAVQPSGGEDLRRLFREAKKLLSNAFAVGLPEALDAEAMAQTANILSDDRKEGLAAFLQKRAPVFRGR